MVSINRSQRDVYVLVAVSLLVGLLGSWVWAGQVSEAQRDERDDLNLFLDASSAGWAEVTDQFFAVPESTAQTIGALVLRTASQEEQLALLIEEIRNETALDAAFVGFPDGSFLFVARANDPASGFRTRSTTYDGEVRRVELGWVDEDLELVRAEVDTEDTFDPRERPWYAPLAAGEDTAWTEPYLFASSEQPGITHSAAIRAPSGELTAVVGIDIRLSALSQFLDQLRPGDNGEALVVDRNAQVIAAAPMNTPAQAVDSDTGLLPLEESSELAGLIAQLDVEKLDNAALNQSGLRTTVARPAGIGNDWYLAVRALDTDFLGPASTEPAQNTFEIAAVGISLASVVALAGLAVLRYLRALRDDADRDELTGLLSRRAAKRSISNALDRTTPSSIAIIDLDRFKGINDAHGHLTGDQALKEIANRIQEFADMEHAEAGRLGGDEFVVVAGPDTDWTTLSDLLRQPVGVGETSAILGASIGVAHTEPGQDETVIDVLRRADDALFEVKRAGGGRHKVAPEVAGA